MIDFLSFSISIVKCNFYGNKCCQVINVHSGQNNVVTNQCDAIKLYFLEKNQANKHEGKKHNFKLSSLLISANVRRIVSYSRSLPPH